MDSFEVDFNMASRLDGNACAGILQEIFADDVTACPTQCATCGYQGDLGTLQAYLDSPGVVIRCPVCEKTMIRITTTPSAIYLDTRGCTYLRISRH